MTAVRSAIVQRGKSPVAPAGFVAGAVGCGIKNPAKLRLDLTLIASRQPATAAGVFTTNRIKAAPVRLCQRHLKAASADIRAIIANSGNSNCSTGKTGVTDARTMASSAARELGLKTTQVLVCSTGLIGKLLPMERITPRIPELAAGLKPGGLKDAAAAIMTSDTVPKTYSVKAMVAGKPVRITGIAKGSGMIRPDMATMLSFIVTDAAVEKNQLDAALREAVSKSFNCISVDGDMSTNDTVLLLANGAAGNKPVTKGTRAASDFQEALDLVALKLARGLVKDGEKATKLIDIVVRGAKSKGDARLAAEAVANSSLVKCSWNGSDPNWGRVVHALGYSGARLREEKIDIYFNHLPGAIGGLTASTPIAQLKKIVERPEFRVVIDLHMGKGEHTVMTADLSPEYVEYNRMEYALKGS